ncbi:unnamed protein product [Pedinophyceae sp. YPF-701]|nr:unnamed protein product [Pedinophyceae sp. YPF-701]
MREVQEATGAADERTVDDGALETEEDNGNGRPKKSRRRSGTHFGLTAADVAGMCELRGSGELWANAAEHRCVCVADIASRLCVDPSRGLDASDTDDLRARERQFGSNRIPEPEPLSLWDEIVAAFDDLTLRVLSVSGLLSLGLEAYMAPAEGGSEAGWVEGAAILAAVAVCVLVAAGNNYQKEAQFRQLNAVEHASVVRVLRCGVPCECLAADLLPGDVLFVEAGDVLPADGVLLEGSAIEVDEAHLTGESERVRKDVHRRPLLLSGSRVLDGFGKMLVVAVGDNSQQGIIARLVTGRRAERAQDESDTDSGSEYVSDAEHARQGPRAATITPVIADDADGLRKDTNLSRRLEGLAQDIGKVGLAAAGATFGALLARPVVLAALGAAAGDAQGVLAPLGSPEQLREVLHAIISAITVLVVAIPEGLPLAVTIALAFSVTRMLGDNNLVRHLGACETMGCATTICSDKTGTLTRNEMTVVRAWYDGCEVGGVPLVGPGAEEGAGSKLPDCVDRMMCVAFALNSTATPQIHEKTGDVVFVGNQTEAGLLRYARDHGVDVLALRDTYALRRLVPFSSDRKRMTAAVALARPPQDLPHPRVWASAGVQMDSDGSTVILSKGAPEAILERCVRVLCPDGSTRALPRQDKLDLLERTKQCGALRMLALAVRGVPEGEDVGEWDEESLESDLTLVGLVGLEDPVRPEAPAAIEKCRHAGIKVRMLTGDNLVTGTSIAKQCGIIDEDRGAAEEHPGACSSEQLQRLIEGGVVMEGKTFREQVLDGNGGIKLDEFWRIWPNLRVMGRCSPSDKYTIVTALRAGGDDATSARDIRREVVAVTGDGTNDAPALRAADVGFAMNSGTGIAREASDIVLMDDNFASIVSAVKWGRNVYRGVQRFLQFQLTVNLVAVATACGGAIALEGGSPLSAVQMLWVNLIMDSLASLALATDEPTDALLDQQPFSTADPLIGPDVAKDILGQAAFQLATLTLALSNPVLLGLPGVDPGCPEHLTAVFNAFVMLQLFNQINCRRLAGEAGSPVEGLPGANPLFCGVLGLEAALQVAIVQFGGSWFQTVPLNGAAWTACVGLGATSLLVRYLLRPLKLPSWVRFG